MKKTLFTILAISGLALTSRAALIAHWDFDTYANGQHSVAPESSLLTSSLDVDANFPSGGSASLNSVAGTTTNDSTPETAPNAATQAMQFSGNDQNSKGFNITINAAGGGFSFVAVQYAAVRNNSGANANTWSYSLDGGSTFTAAPVQPAAVGTSYSTLVVDLTSVPQLVNFSGTLVLRNVLSGAGGGTTDFDNIQVLGQVPEPINAALALFGLAFLGVRFGRRLFATAQK